MQDVKPLRRNKLEIKFLAKIYKTDDCWEWIGAKAMHGYGTFRISTNKQVLAHRFSYKLFKGEIPEGFTIDHLCRNHACVNPDHLEACTDKENRRRASQSRKQEEKICIAEMQKHHYVNWQKLQQELKLIKS